MDTPLGPFNKGDTVPDEGAYVCVPCGYHKRFKVGETFTECMSCLSGTDDGHHDEFVDGQEMWEKVVLPKTWPSDQEKSANDQ